jgi:chemotaxis protein methyltransferase CheR
VESLDREREFTFELADFDALRDLIKRNTGISLADSKMEMVYGRISRRLRHLKLRSFADYRSMLESDESEWIEFCNAMTTNLTSFFRESHHFDFLRDHVLRPKLSQPGASRRIRIWSAACSSGEEPYSIAMTVIEALPDFKRWDIRILATDIDSQILATARRGVYPTARLEALAPQRVRDHLQTAQLGAAAADERSVGRRVLPKCHHLFRQGHTEGAPWAHCGIAAEGRSAVPRTL